MKEQISAIIEAWAELYNPQVSRGELKALNETIYLTAYQYINDSEHNKRKWRVK